MLNETELGRPMEDSLAARWPTGSTSDDLRFVLMSVAIQREVGGSLAEPLPDGLRDGARAPALPPQGPGADRRWGGCRPTSSSRSRSFIAGCDLADQPGLHHPLFATATGRVLSSSMLMMMVIGALFLKKIVSIKG